MYKQNIVVKNCANNVAIAAPAIPHLNTTTNNKSKHIFVIAPPIMASSGVRLSPKERSILEKQL